MRKRVRGRVCRYVHCVAYISLLALTMTPALAVLGMGMAPTRMCVTFRARHSIAIL